MDRRIIGRVIDLTLAFPLTLMLLALASTGLIMVEKYLHTPKGNPTAAVYVIVVLGLFGWTGIAVSSAARCSRCVSVSSCTHPP